MLELKNISKDYPAAEGGEPLHILRDITLTVNPGESIAIIGPSGSGKSTLLNIIGSLDRPTSGSIQLNGKNLADLSDEQLAETRNQEIGFIFQSHHLMPQCSVLENVLVPCLAKGKAGPHQISKANQLLDRVGLKDRAGHRPGQLSGGECQRVAVVRSLINGPSLLLADEPTGALDHQTADGLAELLLELNQDQQVALVVVTHALPLAEKMGKVYRLNDDQLETDS